MGLAHLASLDGVIGPAAAATISVTDEGLLRGDGVFEVIRLYAGRPFALDEHLERLGRSAANLRLPIELDAVRTEIDRLLQVAEGKPDPGCLRIVLTRGGRRLLLTEELPEHAPSLRLATVTYAPVRLLDGVKSLSYAANMLATRIAREQGADEALLVTPHGRVLEAPTSSIFWVADGAVGTPPLEDHILDSITRRLVLELSGAEERSCTLADLQGAEEAFLASTTREIQPIRAIDGRAVPCGSDGAGGPVTRGLAEQLSVRIADELG